MNLVSVIEIPAVLGATVLAQEAQRSKMRAPVLLRSPLACFRLRQGYGVTSRRIG
jgi:hypothetical protein